HRVRAVRRGLPDPGADAHAVLRAGVRVARGRHLDEGAAARGAAAARPGRPGHQGGQVVVLGAALHAVLAASNAAAGVPNTDLIVFWIFAPIAVCAAIGMVLSRNAVHSALFLIVNFFCLAVFFLVLGSPFLFAVQIIVYAGAIMVL